jgi:hypothetical protein
MLLVLNLCADYSQKHPKTYGSATYEERFVNLGLDSLQCRRVKTDLVFCYKLTHGLADMNFTKFITLSTQKDLLLFVMQIFVCDRVVNS